jgi:4'-phosphopantetheinyl transferase
MPPLLAGLVGHVTNSFIKMDWGTLQTPEKNTLPNLWSNPPPELALRAGEVHLWRVRLDLPPDIVAAMEPVLSEAEREKAARFHFQQDRERYTTSKACQRSVLGGYLGLEPMSLIFALNAFGKPSLGGETAGGDLHFNLSHTRGLGMLAVARGGELGVDVEQVRDREVDLGIARRFFSPQEVAALEGLPAALQNVAFYTCWTRKEAYIKARGEGLSIPLDQFSVSLAPGRPPALVSHETDPEETRRWDLYNLNLGPGYAGALAVRARSWIFRQFQWPGRAGREAAPGGL